MLFDVDFKITIGDYQLMLLDSVEIHKSVDLLADNCVIKLPGTALNSVLKIEDQIKRGDKVNVKFGYSGDLVNEFFGYLQNISTDGGSISLNCEDSMFLLRKPVADKQFSKVDIKTIANYLIQQTGVNMKVESSLPITYDKFVISKATAYDVLKKMQEETKANIFITEGDRPTLQIHPPYLDKGGDVRYSFQQNIESDDLKYIRAEDKKIQIIVKSTGKDGKVKEVRFGTTGGDQATIEGNGMDLLSMQKVAENEYNRLLYDGYEGSITGWLVPYVAPTWSAEIVDEEYPEKDGWYYVVSVTTSISAEGGKRKVQIGRKLSDG